MSSADTQRRVGERSRPPELTSNRQRGPLGFDRLPTSFRSPVPGKLTRNKLRSNLVRSFRRPLPYRIRYDMHRPARNFATRGIASAAGVSSKTSETDATESMPPFALLVTELTAELALFAAAGFLLFAIDDLIVDLIYFLRAGWRSAAVYSRFPRAFAGDAAKPDAPRLAGGVHPRLGRSGGDRADASRDARAVRP